MIPEDEGGILNATVPIIGSHHPHVPSQNEYDELLDGYWFEGDERGTELEGRSVTSSCLVFPL